MVVEEPRLPDARVTRDPDERAAPRRGVHEPRLELAREVRARVAAAGIGALVGVPLLTHERIIGALALADRTGREFTADDLAAERMRGERQPQTGLHWLLTNYGHAREHLAHIQLTKQLYAREHQAG